MDEEDERQRTWLETFDYPHRKYSSANRAKNLRHSAQPSSGTVGKQKLPVVLVKVKWEHYYTKGTELRTSKKARNNKLLTTQYAPTSLDTANETEQDAWKITDAHIVQPVLKAMNQMYPHLALQTFNENPLGDAEVLLRVDIAVKPTKQADKRPVMLIELKRCYYIHDEEFEDASRPAEGIEEEVERIKKLKIPKVKGKVTSPSSISVQSNAYPFVQQATAYYTKSGCRFVALCDYEHLILLEYHESGNLDTAEVTIVPREHFLRKLLGFMMKACGTTA
ncbi:hypothetical protein DE146DRAFT_628294 [Phaeosphaeria sp. MPI-PUGE-AT-0046c]|nr:hypothetical protein DE146DRAFT_628294 [Phaeosphaeria sp. MPI-PUGE-AT-0046c]